MPFPVELLRFFDNPAKAVRDHGAKDAIDTAGLNGGRHLRDATRP
jgi:hypothetical protein